MDLQSAQSPYTPAGGNALPSTNPPVLGSQVPGMSGGLPALSGLSVTNPNPMAQELSQFGRHGDSMLVHMNPEEVGGLQALAQMHGTSMTINPYTGMPEAFKLGKFLKSMIPTVLGAIATPLTGGLINPFTASMLIGGGYGLATGSLKKGLLAGLQAYGGAALGSAAGLNAGSFGIGQAANTAGAAAGAANTAAGVTANTLPTSAPSILAPAGSTSAIAPVSALNSTPFAAGTTFTGATNAAAGANLATTGAAAITNPAINASANIIGATAGLPAAAAPVTNPGFLGRFAEAARAGLPSGTPAIISKNIPMIAGGSVLSAAGKGLRGSGTLPGGQIDNSFTGPYTAEARPVTFKGTTKDILASSGEQEWFRNSMPSISDLQGRIVIPGSNTEKGTPIYQPVLNPRAKKGQDQYIWTASPYMMPPEQQKPMSLWEALARRYPGYAHGGEVPMDNGAFVMDARSVSEIGNGSSNAGKEILARMGGRPVEGPGDGVSDSVPANIGGTQKARVARDEVIFPAAAVKRLGKGNPQRGTQKLYALMDKAHKARKKAGRGQDTGLRKGLA